MIRALLRMTRAWAADRYLVIPWRSIGWTAAFFVYLFSPIDLIPEYIPFIGVVDDLGLLLILIRSIRAGHRGVRRLGDTQRTVTLHAIPLFPTF